MPDPASVIGILGVCIQLSQEIVKYATYFKHAPKDAANLVTEVVAIEHVLGNLRTKLQATALNGESVDRTSVLFFALNGCQKRLDDIHKTLKSLVSAKSVIRFRRRLIWPFEKADTKDAALALYRFAQIFHFSLTVDGLSAISLAQHDALERIQTSHTDIQEMLEIVKELPSMSIQLGLLTKSERVTDRQLVQLLDAIPCLPYGDRHRDLQITRMEGVGQWILDMPKFVEWRTGRLDNGTLWCNGAPGAGKTYISSVVTDHLQKLVMHSNSTILFFYFDYKLQSEQTPLKFIQTLLHQLLSSFSTVPPEAEELYQTTICKRQRLPAWNELKAIFFDICNSSKEVFIVIDALDECDKEVNRDPIVEFIKEVKLSKAKLLVTSRPYPADIDELLGTCSQILIEASEKDIRAYIQDRISRSTQISKLIDTELRVEIVKSVTSKSQGMFLLPALQMNNILGQTNQTQIRTVLKSLPSGLADNILQTIERIKTQHSQSNARAELALKVLMWLTTVRRPLTSLELQHAIAIDPEKNCLEDLTDADFFVDCCFGLVVIDEMSIVKLVHFSVSECLETRREVLFPYPERQLALSCLSYLLVHAKKQDTTALEDYSSRYWGMHAVRGFDDVLGSKVQEFHSSTKAFNNWADLLKNQTNSLRWSEEQDWVPTAKYIAKGQTLMHLAAVFGIPKLCRDNFAEQPSGLNSPDAHGNTPLMLAAACGSLDIVEFLLKETETDMNARNAENRTALWHAVHQRRLPVVQALLGSPRYIDINSGNAFYTLCARLYSEDPDDFYPLFISRPELDPNAADMSTYDPPWVNLALDWKLNLLQELVVHPNFDPWRSGRPSKHHDDYYNYHKNIDYDFECGESMTVVPAIVKLMESDSRFAFTSWYALELIWPFVYYAFAPSSLIGVETHRYVDWMAVWDDKEFSWRNILRKFLESHEISVDYRDSEGRGFLHYLAKMGEIEERYANRMGMVDFLLERQRPDIKDHNGNTPLHLAAQHGHIEILKKLVSAGADVMALTNMGSSAIHFAASGGQLDILEHLVKSGVDAHVKDHYGETVLHSAMDAPDETVENLINYLAERGLDVNAENAFGQTPLHYAVYKTDDLIAKTLLRHGADPAKCTKARGTPLHDATFYKPERFAILLTHYSKDLNQLDSFGMSVLDYLQDFAPDFRRACGLTVRDWASYIPTALDSRKKHILPWFRERLDLMISANDNYRESLFERSGFALLKLGDESAAQVMLELDIAPESRQGTAFFRQSYCGGCYKDEGALYKCKTCPRNWLCEKCKINRDMAEGDAPQCLGHQFLKVPSDGWKNIPAGKVNQQDQTFLEWLVDLRERYQTMEE